MKRLVALVLLLLAFAPLPAFAVQPDEILPDPALEQRARALSAQMRCLVCQNQSIDDSDAPLAKDIRLVIRERLKAGDTDTQVTDYLVDRYGQFVLLKPRFEPETWILWLTPFAVVLLGLGYMALRSRQPAAPVGERPLTEAEIAELERLQMGSQAVNITKDS
ncbi:MAG: cytochrome c-type biogenesis protein [Hyphomicrobiales bacterium]